MTTTFRTTTPMTDLSTVSNGALVGLPDDPADVVAIPRHLFVHEFLADPMYGVADHSALEAEIETRAAAKLVGRIQARSDDPLVVPRLADHRVLGNCRQFSLLAVALLRHVGVPARLRAGFASYFDDGWSDHWIVEREDPATGRWLRSDPQLDDVQTRAFGLDFDPLNLPSEVFLTGSEAWQRCRSGEDDPERFGIQDMHGEWFIACNAIRDLACLTGTEPHVWDTWGVMHDIIGKPLAKHQRDLIDRVAKAVVGDAPDAIAEVASINGIAIPTMVTSHRTGQVVALP